MDNKISNIGAKINPANSRGDMLTAPVLGGVVGAGWGVVRTFRSYNKFRKISNMSADTFKSSAKKIPRNIRKYPFSEAIGIAKFQKSNALKKLPKNIALCTAITAAVFALGKKLLDNKSAIIPAVKQKFSKNKSPNMNAIQDDNLAQMASNNAKPDEILAQYNSDQALDTADNSK